MCALILVAGCSTVPVSPRAQQIIMQRDISTQLAGCDRLGPLYTDTQGNPLNFDAVADAAFREQAIEKYGNKADNIVLINRRPGPAGRIVLQGMAYNCFK